MVHVGFIESLWEKPIWEFGPTWNPMDSVCCVYSRTASMESNVPGKYGPHGELFFFLIQKEPALAPVDETFSPSIKADIRTSPFSAEVLKKCALVALHLLAEGRRRRWMSCSRSGGPMESGLPKESNCGRVKTNRGRKTKVCLLVALEALHVIRLYGPGDKISLFLKD